MKGIQVQVGQWVVLFLVKCKVPSVLETASGEQYGEVLVVVTGGITEIRGE